MNKYNKKYWNNIRYQKISCQYTNSGWSYNLQVMDLEELKIIFICWVCWFPIAEVSLENLKYGHNKYEDHSYWLKLPNGSKFQFKSYVQAKNFIYENQIKQYELVISIIKDN